MPKERKARKVWVYIPSGCARTIHLVVFAQPKRESGATCKHHDQRVTHQHINVQPPTTLCPPNTTRHPQLRTTAGQNECKTGLNDASRRLGPGMFFFRHYFPFIS